MKNRFAILTLLIILPVVIFAGATILNFEAHPEEGSVVVTWQTINETSVDYFAVERRSVHGAFVEISKVNPDPSKEYKYVDASAFKSSETIYTYRLKVVDTDGSYAYSNTYTVADHNVSSAYKRTWGSIKALFR